MEMAFPIVAPDSEVEDSSLEAAQELDASSRVMIQDCFYQCLVSLLVRYHEFVVSFAPPWLRRKANSIIATRTACLKTIGRK